MTCAYSSTPCRDDAKAMVKPVLLLACKRVRGDNDKEMLAARLEGHLKAMLKDHAEADVDVGVSLPLSVYNVALPVLSDCPWGGLVYTVVK